MALGPYEHIRDLQTGDITVEGVDLNFLNLPTLEIFHRMTERQELMSRRCRSGARRPARSRRRTPDRTTGVSVARIPTSSIFIRREGPIREPADFQGKRRIGVPEWSQTAAIYVRGWFMHEAGGRMEDSIGSSAA